MSVCVSKCVCVRARTRWRARASRRARMLLAMQTVHTLRAAPPLRGGGGRDALRDPKVLLGHLFVFVLRCIGIVAVDGKSGLEPTDQDAYRPLTYFP